MPTVLRLRNADLRSYMSYAGGFWLGGGKGSPLGSCNVFYLDLGCGNVGGCICNELLRKAHLLKVCDTSLKRPPNFIVVVKFIISK